MKKDKRTQYLGIDIGSTWIKGTVVDEEFFQIGNTCKQRRFEVKKINSPLHAKTTLFEFVEALKELINCLNIQSNEIKGVGISTAGIVNYHGTQVLQTAEHLNILKDNS